MQFPDFQKLKSWIRKTNPKREYSTYSIKFWYSAISHIFNIKLKNKHFFQQQFSSHFHHYNQLRKYLRLWHKVDEIEWDQEKNHPRE